MPFKIPVLGGGRAPEPPPYGGLGENGWARGKTFLEVVESAANSRADWETAFRSVQIAAEVGEFFAAYPRRARVLALGDPEMPDTCVNVAQAERLFSLGRNIWMRLFWAAENSDILELFAAAARGLPLLVFFGEDRHEFARWGPRPRALQELESSRHWTPAEIALLRRDYYARNHGRDLASELHGLLAPRLGP